MHYYSEWNPLQYGPHPWAPFRPKIASPRGDFGAAAGPPGRRAARPPGQASLGAKWLCA